MKKKRYSVSDFVIPCVLIAWGLLIFYPFYNSILVSFMSQGEYMRNPFALFVKNPTIVAYEEIFSNNRFLYGYKNTISILAVRLPLALTIECAAGYALSRNRFFLSKTINNLMVFTMYFTGGVIPLYLLVKEYGLMNKLASIMLIGCFGAYNTILFKNFFYSIPDSLEESAKVDGANDIRIFGQIYVPLAKPIIATVALFIAVAVWNEWYHPMLYLTDTKKWPLQLVLREIINNATAQVKEEVEGADVLLKETFDLNVQMASVVVTMLPVMLIYPFVQKFFMKGLTVGAVKG